MNDLMSVRPELLSVFLAVGVGTYLMRAIPLLASLGHLRKDAAAHPALHDSREPVHGHVLRVLRLVAPAVIAALLVGSVLPAEPGPGASRQLALALGALVATAWAAMRWRHLGLTVAVGIASYWLLALLA